MKIVLDLDPRIVQLIDGYRSEQSHGAFLNHVVLIMHSEA